MHMLLADRRVAVTGESEVGVIGLRASPLSH